MNLIGKGMSSEDNRTALAVPSTDCVTMVLHACVSLVMMMRRSVSC